MIQVTPHMRILVAHEAVDFRKGIDGLVHLCKEKLKEDPFVGTAFVFRNRPQTSIKILIYDGQGFWLCHKRLSKGRFKWLPTSGRGSSDLEAFRLQVLMVPGNPSEATAAESWKQLLPAGAEISKSGVPEDVYKVRPHGNDTLQGQGDRGKGDQVHKGPDRGIPGIQST